MFKPRKSHLIIFVLDFIDSKSKYNLRTFEKGVWGQIHAIYNFPHHQYSNSLTSVKMGDKFQLINDASRCEGLIKVLQATSCIIAKV